MNRTRTKAPAGVNLPALRHHNAALVLDLLRAAGAEGISRLELAEGTGLTPQAVSKITARLREDGLAVGAGLRPSTGGKPRTVLRLVPDAQFAVGLHLDRDGLTAVLVDLAGRPVAVTRAPLDLGAPADRVLADAADAVRDLCAAEPHKPVLGVGVAVPGPLDHRDGVLRRVTGFPQWDGYPLRAALAERTGLPVVLDKDTNAAALAVALSLDEPRGDFAYLHLGTGLGAGLVLGGEVHRGARTGRANSATRPSSWTARSAAAADAAASRCCAWPPRRAATGEAARILGTGAANLVGLLGVDRVVLGGRTVAADEDAYVRGVRAVIEERAARGGAGAGVTVTVARGGDRPVAEGAAQLVLAPVFGRVGAEKGSGGRSRSGAPPDC